MATLYERALRLTTALEELAARETALLHTFHAGRSADIAALAAQADPLITALGEVGDRPEINALLPRIAALMRRRAENAAVLDTHLDRLRAELHRLDRVRQSLSRLTPVYGIEAEAGASAYLNATV